MKKAFADAVYWVAIMKPRDPLAGKAKAARNALGKVRIVTSDDVLSEFLALLGIGNKKIRATAVTAVRKVLANPEVEVVPHSRESFVAGLDLYERRSDKTYSLVDCVSMNIMRTQEITDALTHDKNFEQEGFNRLIK